MKRIDLVFAGFDIKFALAPGFPPAAWLVAAAIVMTSACSSEPEVSRSLPRASIGLAGEPIYQARKEKDRAFKEDPGSPIPEADRVRFESLAYYDVSPKYRFQVKLHRYPRPETLRLATNTGEERDALRYGYFEFQLDGETHRLHVYRTFENLDSTGSNLFIPFRDATSGKETYAAGRYLDLIENTTGTYTLDFNLAYNPFCVYSPTYSCPFPPRENYLPIPIPAGEKIYRLGEGS